MCGIVGWVAGPGTRPKRALLQKMGGAIAHRGPDASGEWIQGCCGLAHKRLSILDLEGGAQPMQSEDGQIAIVFNGQIYNHRELRRELERQGCRFTSRSDTEVLIHGYRVWGDALPGKLNGMFAFMIWDVPAQRALVVRDRLGQKPLFHTQLADGTLLVASELKAILAHPGVERRLDLQAIATYLSLEYIPWPMTAIQGVHKLGPGDLLVWEDNKVRISPWSRPPFDGSTVDASPAEWMEATRQALSRAVERRLQADVPVGVFLSGGIDSSAIVALAAEQMPASELQTFSIGFEDAGFDESSWAAQVARSFGTRHHVETFRSSTLEDLLPQVISWLDEPFGDASLLPTHLLSRLTGQHVKVALGGDGGDELFAGYETFRADTVAQVWRRLPAPLRALGAGAVERLPVQTGNFSLDFVAKSFVRGASAPPEFRHTRWMSSFLPNEGPDPLLPELRAQIPDVSIYRVMAAPYLECPDPRHLQRLAYTYIRTWLAEDILTKVDRASMAAGLEVRAPFLDPEVVSLAARMPPELKLKGGFQAKWILKKALAKHLPKEILYRKKKGFGIPVARWLNGPLAPELNRLMDPERLRAGGLLDPQVVQRLIAEHRAGSHDHRKGLWTLMMLEYWRERSGASL